MRAKVHTPLSDHTWVIVPTGFAARPLLSSPTSASPPPPPPPHTHHALRLHGTEPHIVFQVPAYKLASLKERFPNARFVNLDFEIDYDNGKSFKNSAIVW
mgnify:CR=1 FL=1